MLLRYIFFMRKPVSSKPTEPEVESVFGSRKSALSSIQAVASRFSGFRPAREILTRIKSVPTIFPQFDWATRVGGLPLERFMVVHGPSNHGKTAFTLGLGLSFLVNRHFFAYVDAEMTTPISWLEQLMSVYADDPLFVALRPKSYEQTVDSVRSLLDNIANAKEKGEIDKSVSCLIVVDSLRKLIPEKIFEKVSSGKGGVDGMGGRSAQVKAALNAAWLDELVPALYHSGSSMIAIARESENTEATGAFDRTWKMTGGKAIEYDSSLVMRISRHSWVKRGQAEDAEVLGEKHTISIRKTKLAAKDDKEVRCFFHTSNGKVSGVGFDRARDIVDLGISFGIIKKSSSWLLFDSKRYNGINTMVQSLNGDEDTLLLLEDTLRQHYKDNDPYLVDTE